MLETVISRGEPMISTRRQEPSVSAARGRFFFISKACALFLALGYLSTAYSDTSGSPQAPGTPEAYAFEDFSKSHTVDPVTGNMALTLPLYTVPTPGDLEYKVQLTYAAGIKTEQLASEVGLGWNINKPSFSRSVNGMPDDVYGPNEDNYHYWKKLPAIYPAHIFEQQKSDLRAARKKAQRKMIGNLVKTAALTAVTFGAGAALAPGLSAAASAGSKAAQVGAKVLTAAQSQYSGRALASTAASTAQGVYQSNQAAAKSMKSLKKQQDKIRKMIDNATVQSNTMKLNGKIYTGGYNSDDMSDMDYQKADSYFLNAPGYATQLILLEPSEVLGNRLFPTSFQSDIPQVGWDAEELADMQGEYAHNFFGYNDPFVTVTENNMVGLIDTVGDDFEGYLFVDAQGHRYLFDTETEWAVAANVGGFVPVELEDSMPMNGYFSSFSWRDHYPGGISNAPEDLRAHNGERVGAAEYQLKDHILNWGITRIQDGNKALYDKGNEIFFEYEEMPLSDGVFTVAETSIHKTGNDYYDFEEGAFSTSPSGHKVISRGYKTFKLLHKVVSETHEVEFNYDYNNRYDGKEAFAASPSALDGRPLLASIVMYAKQDGERRAVSKYVFEYDHSLMYGAPDNENADPMRTGESCGSAPEDCGRLTLKSLQYASYASGSWSFMPKMEFEYANGDTPVLLDACEGEPDNWVTKCLLEEKSVNEGLAATANPRYLRGATDRWGHFFLPTHELNLHNEFGMSNNYMPEAWSLTKVNWPSGGSTAFAYEADRYRSVNDLDLGSTRTGGGVRVSYVEQCDGMGNCYYDNYVYNDCHSCIVDGGTYDCSSHDPIDTGSMNDMVHNMLNQVECTLQPECISGSDACLCAEGSHANDNCPGTWSNSGDSGYALGVPPTTSHSLDFQKLERLEDHTSRPEYLIQSEYFNVQYTQVTEYQSATPLGEANWGMTVREFTGPLDTMENEDGESIKLAGGGHWAPQRILHGYNWQETGSQGGSSSYHANDPHSDDVWVGFNQALYVPKKGNDTYNYLKFKDDGKYYVSASEPGYLFWVWLSAGLKNKHWHTFDPGPCHCSGCQLVGQVQHPNSRPPFIAEPCPGGEENVYCGTVEFSKSSKWHNYSWDFHWSDGGGDMDCKDPKDVLVFCPAGPDGNIDDVGSSHDYNPLAVWNSGGDWRNTVENKFTYGHDHDDNSWRTNDMPWGSKCYQIFGGSDQVDSGETLDFSDSATTCVDNFNETGGSGANEHCDLAEHETIGFSMGKEIRPYALGLTKSVKKYHRDNLNWPKYSEENTYELASYDALERSSIYVGKVRLVSTTKTQDNVEVSTTYSGFDEYTGLPKRTEVMADGKSIITDTDYAYEDDDLKFGKKHLNMLTLQGQETISGDPWQEWGSSPLAAKQTNYVYANEWGLGDYGADGAWLLQKTIQTNFNGENQEHTVVAYDKYLHPLVVEDGNGNRTSYRYGDKDDPCGDVQSLGDSEAVANMDGVFVLLSDLENSKVTCIQNELGHRKIYEYNDHYQLSKIVNAQGLETDYSYDELGRLAEINVHTKYNDNDWDQSFEYGFMRETGEPNMIMTHTNNGSSDVTYSDGMGRRLQERELTEAGGEVLVTNYAYNDRGLLSKASRPKTGNGLDFEGETISSNEDEYTSMTYHADPLGRVHREYPLGRTTAGGDNLEKANHYGNENNLAKKRVEDANGNSVSTYKTAFGHPAKNVDALEHETHYSTDALGRILTVTDALGRVSVENVYNSLGQLVERIRFPDSSTPESTTYEYDQNGNLTAETQGDQGTIVYTYDALNRLTKTNYPDATADVVNFYDTDGDAPSSSCAGKRFTPYGCNLGDLNNDYSVDVLDVVSTVQIILGTHSPNEQELCGGDFNVDTTVDILDVVAMVSFIMNDNDNDDWYQADLPGSIAYNSNGLLCRVQHCVDDDCSPGNGASFIAYNYDRQGRIIGMQTEHGYTFYELDSVGQPVMIYHPITQDRRKMYLSYDAGGRITSVNIDGIGEVSYQYANTNGSGDFAGRLKSISYPNGWSTQIRTNDRGLIEELLLQDSLGDVGWMDKYDYDRMGNVDSVSSTVDDSKTASFVYDANHRLYVIDDAGYYEGLGASNIEYSYDSVGNRSYRYIVDGFWEGCYRDQVLGEVYVYEDDSNRLTSTDYEGCDYAYDSKGNLTAMNNCRAESDQGTNAWQMSYDARNRLTSVDVDTDCPGHVNFTEVYTYDPLGRRIGKLRQGHSKIEYAYGLNDQPLSVVIDSDVNADDDPEVTHYYYAGGRLLAKENGSDVFFVHQDRLMSNRVETDLDGSIRAEMLAAPFGHQLINDGIRMSFATGKELDDTGLYYFGDRFYDPNLGRFTSPDQLAEKRPADSAYIYAGNNPMNRVDPDGNYWFLVTGAVSAVVDYGSQVATNWYAKPDGTWGDVLWNDVSMSSVAVSFGAGMAGGGITTLSKAKKISTVTKHIATTTVSVSSSVSNQALSGEGVSFSKTATDFVMGHATKKLASPVNDVLGELVDNEAVSYSLQKVNSKLVSKTIGVLTADPGINKDAKQPVLPLNIGEIQGTTFGFQPAVQDNTFVKFPQ